MRQNICLSINQSKIFEDKQISQFFDNYVKIITQKFALPMENQSKFISNYSSTCYFTNNFSKTWFPIQVSQFDNRKKLFYENIKNIKIDKLKRQDLIDNQKIKLKIKSLQEKPFTFDEKNRLIYNHFETYYKKYISAQNEKDINKREKRLKQLQLMLENNIQKVADSQNNPYRETKIKQLNKQLGKRIKVKKIRLYLNKEQKNIFKRWTGTCRYIYNKITNKCNKKQDKINFNTLRDKYIPKKQISETEKWMLETPKQVRAEVIRDFTKAYSSTMSLFKTGKIDKFKMKFRSKKNLSESFVVPHSSMKINSNNSFTLFKNFLSENSVFKFSKKEKLPNIFEFDCRIKYYKPNYWYIFIPYTVNEYKKSVENQNTKIISLD